MGKTSARPGSKAERKFEKKLEFYGKVRASVTSLSAQKSITKKSRNQQRREKKLKAYDLSALCGSLPDLESLTELKARRQPVDNLKLNCKSRKKILMKEQGRFLQNLNNPSFQTDPLSAIHQHLLSTQPVVEEQPKKKVNKNGSMKRKEKKLKALVKSQNMEMSF
ncbi:uncharacterized protein LOC114711323 isoform X2 [Neltuma alba]|uniref:uncharacterized protein LOC114711323 isoform X2 n=1 Tax=Neltuma alba TaxID=207710 RepID=UPI0010A4E55A|nr:uncharacterized protein LOC114711323 isoform X2 [Prosopis alba]XP_028751541.1 uncharacterized protein LOC114711323 isoform X2 [Prosopis alba]